MPCLKKSSLIAFLYCACLSGAPAIQAQEKLTLEIPEGSVLSDGELTREEMAQYVVIAKEQLSYLSEQATEDYAQRVKAQAEVMPGAWMLMDDGVTVKELTLDEAAEGAPASVRVVMFRAALKSIARRGKINGAVILYAGQLSETNKTSALVIEHEHRLGISGTKIVPYTVDGDDLKFAKSVTQDKPFQFFYDSKPSNAGAS